MKGATRIIGGPSAPIVNLGWSLILTTIGVSGEADTWGSGWRWLFSVYGATGGETFVKAAGTQALAAFDLEIGIPTPPIVLARIRSATGELIAGPLEVYEA